MRPSTAPQLRVRLGVGQRSDWGDPTLLTGPFLSTCHNPGGPTGLDIPSEGVNSVNQKREGMVQGSFFRTPGHADGGTAIRG